MAEVKKMNQAEVLKKIKSSDAIVRKSPEEVLMKLNFAIYQANCFRFDDLSNSKTFDKHAILMKKCGNLLLSREFKEFEVDDYNRKILRFLLYYFNGSKLAEEVFPDRDYKVHKSLLICGDVGTGKTLLMQLFSEYLKRTNNINFFENLSVTQMLNYYKLHNHLDKYTYNEEGAKTFGGNAVNVCLNDVGLQSHIHFGQDTKVVIDDFFHARAELWAQNGKYAHVTTNLTPSELKDYFTDDYGRLVDRLKNYNIIHLNGGSRR